MTDDSRSRKQLCTRIKSRQIDIDDFLGHARPRRNALTNVSIVCSALAAAFTAGPALGGPKGMQGIANSFSLPTAALVWRPLCFAAFLVAVAAAITANLHRSYDLPARVAAAETCHTELESLLTQLDFDNLPLHNAVEHYQQSIQKIPFVPEKKFEPALTRR